MSLGRDLTSTRSVPAGTLVVLGPYVTQLAAALLSTGACSGGIIGKSMETPAGGEDPMTAETYGKGARR